VKLLRSEDEDGELHLAPFSCKLCSSPLVPPTPPLPRIVMDSPLASESCVPSTTPASLTSPAPPPFPADNDPYTAFTVSSHSEIPHPLTPPPIGKLPTCWRKVRCRKCHRDAHDISYRHCIECHFKEIVPLLLLRHVIQCVPYECAA
jgi:hypothetical protein